MILTYYSLQTSLQLEKSNETKDVIVLIMYVNSRTEYTWSAITANELSKLVPREETK